MIPSFILKKVIIPLIEKTFFKMFDQQAEAFKLSKTLDYMELPNDLDRGVEKLQVENEMLKSQMKDMTDSINKLNNKFDKVKKIRSL